ncbi:hypothetical protein PR048_012156 [Dryococelus australis]|uniref:Uncharacterized protein n=1 Tax=Dryococelus australis TaxID=614101 RepID=A0ABQ9HNT2_9NEOP|nr:hypothetical protein PR048_012156 [Dryococelus australis]
MWKIHQPDKKLEVMSHSSKCLPHKPVWNQLQVQVRFMSLDKCWKKSHRYQMLANVDSSVEKGRHRGVRFLRRLHLGKCFRPSTMTKLRKKQESASRARKISNLMMQQ